MAIPSELDVLRALAALPEGKTLGQDDLWARWSVQGGAEFWALLRLLTELERAGWLVRYATSTQHFQYQITTRGLDQVARSGVRR